MKITIMIGLAVGCLITPIAHACTNFPAGAPDRTDRNNHSLAKAGRASKPTRVETDDPFAKGGSRLKAPKEAGSTYYKMRTEVEIPCLAPLATNYQALPKRTALYPTRHNGAEARMAFHKVGTGQHSTVLVCVHGIMGDSQSWRYLGGALGGDYDLWLVDLLGCGDSDAPDPAKLGADGYSPSDLADRLLQALTASLAENSPELRVVIVGHSFGGLVTLRAFMDPELRTRHTATLDRIQGLVLLAPCDVLMNKADPHFESLANLSGTKVGLADGLGVIRELTAKYLLESSSSGWCTPREEVDNALHVVCDAHHRRAFQAMLRTALPFDPATHRPNWSEMEKLESWYLQVKVPCRILWGERDETLPVTMGYKMAAQLPNASLAIVPGGMHSPVYECPGLYARLIRETIRGLADTAGTLTSIPARPYRVQVISNR